MEYDNEVDLSEEKPEDYVAEGLEIPDFLKREVGEPVVAPRDEAWVMPTPKRKRRRRKSSQVVQALFRLNYARSAIVRLTPEEAERIIAQGIEASPRNRPRGKRRAKP